MSVLWTSSDAVAATGGQSHSEWQATGVSIDTRSLQEGDLFVALTDQRDGHDFVVNALEKGAAAALVSKIPDGLPNDAPLLVVPDVLAALGQMAVYARERTRAKVIAVTGSMGKTGTKEMLRTAFNAVGRVHAAEKSYNNHWGVPLTLARMPVDVDYAVIEIGMNHPGEIEPLAKMTTPNAAIITNIAPVHMAAFDNLEGIAREKAAIFSGLEVNRSAIICGDTPFADLLEDKAREVGARIYVFGNKPCADFRVLDTTLDNGKTHIKASVLYDEFSLSIGGEGSHLAVNAMAALAAVYTTGADLAAASQALSDWVPPQGRGARFEVGGISVIDESYNANPLSMRAALSNLSKSLGDRRVAVLGDMLELGQEEVSFHRDLAKDASLNEIDVVHCVGPLMKNLHEALPKEKRGEYFSNSKDLLPMLLGDLKAGDVVMFKGSLGSKMGLLVDAIKNMGKANTNTNTGDIT